jgi:phenylacetate-CoA ligase
MPLIRYKTGDIVTMDGESCECGRKYDLIKNVEGRKQDFIVLKNNNIIPLTSLIIAVKHLEHFPSIIRFQFIQREPGRVKLKIMGDKQKIIDDSARLKHGIFTVLGNQLEAEIEYVDYIPLTKRGKHRRLIQNISFN